ncbi:MAG: FAD-dependent monooxygenase [Myxococcales bacterium]|nr:FAD-dependent monooxygenase [Myxococcales bacterium]
MSDHAVVIVGGGPTGMMLAAELTLAGVDALVVERRTSQVVDGSRAGGLHARTLEVLDQRGVADRFIAAGQRHPAVSFSLTPLDIRDLPTRHNCVLALWQSHIERILAEWVYDELGVPVLRGREVVSFTQDDRGVDVALAGGGALRAGYLVGCDGGRSMVRKTAGIAFPGSAAATSWMIAEVEMDGEPELGFRRDRVGTHALGRRAAGEPIRVVLTERDVGHAGAPDLRELRDALVSVYGTDFGLRGASWISRFTDAARQAAEYRRGRVLLAGDAAHVHPPHGGQGLNTGVQDAVNLGWKLAQVVDGTSPEHLLDTYHAERHPVGARALRSALAMVALGIADDRHDALRETVTELLGADEARRRVVAMIAGLDIRYELGDGHPLIGRRVPDVDVRTDDGPTRIYELLRDARPVLLTLGEPDALARARWPGRVRRVHARRDGAWTLPVVGEVAAPEAALIRPDGHVAWVGALADPGLSRALETWFGATGPARSS